MIESFLVAAAAVVIGAAAGAVVSLFEQLWGVPSATEALPESLSAEMSEYDQMMASRTTDLINRSFSRDGMGVMDSIRNMNAQEREDAAQNFANELARLYGLEGVKIDFFEDRNTSNCGSYNYVTNTANFNIVELMWRGDDEQFEARIRNFIDTIVHEERHAVQHRVIREPGFWQIDEERRTAWARNTPPPNKRYIRASVDIRRYRTQPVERDAFTFADLALRGVQ